MALIKGRSTVPRFGPSPKEPASTPLEAALRRAKTALNDRHNPSALRSILTELVLATEETGDWRKRALEYCSWKGEGEPDAETWMHDTFRADTGEYQRGYDNGWQNGFLSAGTTVLLSLKGTPKYNEAYDTLKRLESAVTGCTVASPTDNKEK